MHRVDSTVAFRVLRKMASPLSESAIDTRLDALVCKLQNANNPIEYVSAVRLVQEYVIYNSNKETSDYLMERLEDHRLIPKDLSSYDIGTYEGFMKAVDDVMEMFSGAAIGGRMSGMGTNADINATGMAGQDPLLGKKKKSRIKKILTRNL